jgi:hypothetical protein
MRKLNLLDKRFGRLVVIKETSNIGRWTAWVCKCDCGNEVVVKTHELQLGDTQSCGCLFRETLYKNITKHNGKGSRLYNIWCHMKTRCLCETDRNYKWYGAKGVSVCEEWKNDYLAFQKWALSNGYSGNLTIDRINPFGNYEPNNCRWITIQEQQRNKRRNYKEA